LTIVAPASSAAAMVAALRVSTETQAPRAASAAITGTIRATSSGAATGCACGRVLSPPMSMISAPASSIAIPAVTAACGVPKSPPSEKESGVTFRIPITRGRRKSNPAQTLEDVALGSTNSSMPTG
jgi:hypothetical protein